MTEHSIEADFKVAVCAGTTEHTDAEKRVILAMSQSIAGANYEHPAAIFEATKIFRAVTAMREAERKEGIN